MPFFTVIPIIPGLSGDAIATGPATGDFSAVLLIVKPLRSRVTALLAIKRQVPDASGMTDCRPVHNNRFFNCLTSIDLDRAFLPHRVACLREL
jgi:hypothetical protein